MYFQRVKKWRKDNSTLVVVEFGSLEVSYPRTGKSYKPGIYQYRFSPLDIIGRRAPKNRSLLRDLYCAKLNIIKDYATTLEQRGPW